MTHPDPRQPESGEPGLPFKAAAMNRLIIEAAERREPNPFALDPDPLQVEPDPPQDTSYRRQGCAFALLACIGFWAALWAALGAALVWWRG